MISFNNIIVSVGTTSIFFSFIFSIAIVKAKNNRGYMKYFFLCPLIAILISANTILNNFYSLYTKPIYFSLQNSLALLDLVFWLIFFSHVINNKSDSSKLRIIFFVTFSIVLFSSLYNPLDKPNLHLVSLFNICKTLFCLYFYHNLFRKDPEQKIKSEPSFWVITGLFFYSSLSIPFYALNGYLRSRFPLIIWVNLFAISNIMIIIMHFFFIKAYICTIRMPKA